jgi:microcompartment protein CcmK/EutM
LFPQQTQRWHTFPEEERAAVEIVVAEADLAEEEVAIEEVGEGFQEVVEVDEVSFTSPRSDSRSRILNRWVPPLQLRKDFETKSS